jgi:hypothetical protein
VAQPAVVERRVAGELERDRAPDRAGLPDQEIARLAGGPRLRDHEVDDLADRVLALEPGEQDVGIGEVELLRLGVAGTGRDGEVAALVLIQEGTEQARGVEARRAVPVDRAVGADEGDRAQVAHDAVLFDREVAVRRADPGSPVSRGGMLHTSNADARSLRACFFALARTGMLA